MHIVLALQNIQHDTFVELPVDAARARAPPQLVRKPPGLCDPSVQTIYILYDPDFTAGDYKVKCKRPVITNRLHSEAWQRLEIPVIIMCGSDW